MWGILCDDSEQNLLFFFFYKKQAKSHNKPIAPGRMAHPTRGFRFFSQGRGVLQITTLGCLPTCILGNFIGEINDRDWLFRVGWVSFLTPDRLYLLYRNASDGKDISLHARICRVGPTPPPPPFFAFRNASDHNNPQPLGGGGGQT